MTTTDSAAATGLDKSALLGDWRNTNANGTIMRINCEPAGDGLRVTCSARDRDWGSVGAPVFAFEFKAKEAGAFSANYSHGAEELRLQANVKLGVLVVVTLYYFRDNSGRSNYFNREFFYRIPS
jgi:hypothetical protein